MRRNVCVHIPARIRQVHREENTMGKFQRNEKMRAAKGRSTTTSCCRVISMSFWHKRSSKKKEKIPNAEHHGPFYASRSGKPITQVSALKR